MSQYTRIAATGLKSAIIATAIVSLMAGPALATSGSATSPTALTSLGDLILITPLMDFLDSIESLVLTIGQAVLAIYIAFQLMYVGVSSQTTQSLVKIVTAAVAFILLQSFDSVRSFLTDNASSVLIPPELGEYTEPMATTLVGSLL